MKQKTHAVQPTGCCSAGLNECAFSARQPIRKGELVLMSHDEVRRQSPNATRIRLALFEPDAIPQNSSCDLGDGRLRTLPLSTRRQ